MRLFVRFAHPSVGLWRSWERASMAWKRSRVRIPSGPPNFFKPYLPGKCRTPKGESIPCAYSAIMSGFFSGALNRGPSNCESTV